MTLLAASDGEASVICSTVGGFSMHSGMPWFSVEVFADLEKLCGSESLAGKEKAAQGPLFYH